MSATPCACGSCPPCVAVAMYLGGASTKEIESRSGLRRRELYEHLAARDIPPSRRSREDLTGRRFGSLVVAGRAGSDAYGQARWLCRCDCGGERVVQRYRLTGALFRATACLPCTNARLGREGPPSVERAALAALGAEVGALIGAERGARSRAAERAGYSLGTVTLVVRGEARPSRELVVRLAGALGADAATRDRWLALAGRPVEAAPERDGEPALCAALGCDGDVHGTRDPACPLRALCDRCRVAARYRVGSLGMSPEAAAAQLVAEGKRGKAFKCLWCARPGAVGSAAFERAPGGGMQCRDGHGCAVKRATRAA